MQPTTHTSNHRPGRNTRLPITLSPNLNGLRQRQPRPQPQPASPEDSPTWEELFGQR